MIHLRIEILYTHFLSYLPYPIKPFAHIRNLVSAASWMSSECICILYIFAGHQYPDHLSTRSHFTYLQVFFSHPRQKSVKRWFLRIGCRPSALIWLVVLWSACLHACYTVHARTPYATRFMCLRMLRSAAGLIPGQRSPHIRIRGPWYPFLFIEAVRQHHMYPTHLTKYDESPPFFHLHRGSPKCRRFLGLWMKLFKLQVLRYTAM